MRSTRHAVIPAALIPFRALPPNDFEVSDEAALAALPIALFAHRRVAVRATGAVYSYDPRTKTLTEETQFTGGTSSAVGVAPRGEGAR